MALMSYDDIFRSASPYVVQGTRSFGPGVLVVHAGEVQWDEKLPLLDVAESLQAAVETPIGWGASILSIAPQDSGQQNY